MHPAAHLLAMDWHHQRTTPRMLHTVCSLCAPTSDAALGDIGRAAEIIATSPAVVPVSQWPEKCNHSGLFGNDRTGYCDRGRGTAQMTSADTSARFCPIINYSIKKQYKL